MDARRLNFSCLKTLVSSCDAHSSTKHPGDIWIVDPSFVSREWRGGPWFLSVFDLFRHAMGEMHGRNW